VSLTTSHAVFIRDPRNGRMRVFTVAELMELVKTPSLASVPVPSARDMLANGVPDSLHHASVAASPTQHAR
jgi:hypothetical protein